MRIFVPRHFKPDMPPADVTLSDQDILAMTAELPAEVVLSSDGADLVFSSPRAAADFVESLKGQVPYTISGVEEQEEAAFLELLATAGLSSESGKNALTFVDPVARSWGIAAFSVAASAAAVAVAALVIGIIALVM